MIEWKHGRWQGGTQEQEGVEQRAHMVAHVPRSPTIIAEQSARAHMVAHVPRSPVLIAEQSARALLCAHKHVPRIHEAGRAWRVV